MKKNYNDVLEDDEQIVEIYQPCANTGDKSIGGEIFLILFCVFSLSLLILSVVFKIGDGAGEINIAFILISMVCLFFISLGVHNIIYKKFTKSRKVKNIEYCLTNKRILVYNSKKNKLTAGSLEKLLIVTIENSKNNYGDILLSKKFTDGNDTMHNLINNRNDMDKAQIVMECIVKPRDVKNKINELQRELKVTPCEEEE